MDYAKLIIYCTVFLIGFLSCAILFAIVPAMEMPLGARDNGNINAPSDRINEEQIHVYDNAIVIDIKEGSLGRYAPTGSMLPILNENSNGIRIVPKNADEINVGDIVTFSRGSDLIIHRVIEKGIDDGGDWFITKGDNSDLNDGKVYFSDIKYLTIGVLW